jgi:hypothetical protein
VKHHFEHVFSKSFEPSEEKRIRAERDCEELDDISLFAGVDLQSAWLESALKDTRLSHVRGFDGISSQMLLNCMSKKVSKCLFLFYKYIFKYGCIPTDFNVSLIRPILKDYKNASDDVKNMRPISVSNTLSQIFERILLIKLPEVHTTHRNQFGFKRFTSTTHALFEKIL